MKLAIIIAGAIVFAACGSHHTADLKVTNGIKKQTSRLAAVISQDGCTGTFVSPTTIITAAHCADHGFTYNGVRTRSFESMPEHHGVAWSFPEDVRVLVFPQPVAPAWIPIATSPVQIGDKITVAGYGIYDLTSGKGDGSFRLGVNKITALESDGQIFLTQGTESETIYGQEGQHSAIGSGDSGGPVLRDGQLVGVIAGSVDLGDVRKSVFVNLTNPKIRDFLQSARQKHGADIRENGEGSNSYQECGSLQRDRRSYEMIFDVPHSRMLVQGGAGTKIEFFGKVSGRSDDKTFYPGGTVIDGQTYEFADTLYGARISIPDDSRVPDSICFQ